MRYKSKCRLIRLMLTFLVGIFMIYNSITYAQADTTMNERVYKITEKGKSNIIKIFTVDSINRNSTRIRGKGVSGAKVGAYVNGKQIGKNTTVGKNGTYTITIPKQKAGTKVVVKISKSGYVTKEKTITVLNSIILNSISVDKKVARPGEKVTITMDIRGASNLDIEYIEVEMGGIKSHQIPVREIVYNDKLKKYQFNIKIDGTMHNCKYSIFTIDIADKFGSRKVYRGDDKSIIDLSLADFKVISKINDYSDIIKSINIDKKSAGIGDSINISVELANNSYVDTIWLNYKNSNISKNIKLTYNKNTNKYSGKFIINKNTKTGVWKPEYIEFKSNTGNWLNSLYDQFGQISSEFNFKVVNKK